MHVSIPESNKCKPLIMQICLENITAQAHLTAKLAPCHLRGSRSQTNIQFVPLYAVPIVSRNSLFGPRHGDGSLFPSKLFQRLGVNKGLFALLRHIWKIELPLLTDHSAVLPGRQLQ
ncbi:hypothetical protein VFPPC_17231 [Pochonia chlamydosporia 170]|uniref:Uncharacterized protein n=1 Tax=Pochonia chlamydosporia 170 TaxID=1380566 RepID=A0A179EWD5_METCM|nr:hypothetical protein VFPPC_17231 [Pochonia chlamydosporia 170]OAQ57229.1 hypothetical protein VFPPC_17231 [Pochonia chlamydosporia 170]